MLWTFFFFKQKTAYELRISDWSSDVCSSDLIRALQEETGGFTEFVPLPFVHMEAPIWRKGNARSVPTYREAVLMHATARIVLHQNGRASCRERVCQYV